MSKSTMLRHRKAANTIREKMGRGLFGYGPKVADLTVEEYEFDLVCSLEQKDSGDESEDLLNLPPPADIGFDQDLQVARNNDQISTDLPDGVSPIPDPANQPVRIASVLSGVNTAHCSDTGSDGIQDLSDSLNMPNDGLPSDVNQDMYANKEY